MMGSRRWVASETRVSSTLTRFHLEGERGTAVATVILDDDGRWFGASLKRRAAEGIANVVLQCPWNEDRDAMSALYDELLHFDRWDVPHLVFDDGAPDDPRHRWPDPAYPQQMHLEIRVGDDDAADALVVRRGVTRLADFDDHRVASLPRMCRSGAVATRNRRSRPRCTVAHGVNDVMSRGCHTAQRFDVGLPRLGRHRRRRSA
jgi:hypothetical protein